MSQSLELLRKAQSLGLTIEADGNSLVVKPRSKCPAELVAELKQHKMELLALLEAKVTNLTPDCIPWFHIARQILAGEFDGCDRSTRVSLTIGLRSTGHSLCRRALDRLMEATSRHADSNAKLARPGRTANQRDRRTER